MSDHALQTRGLVRLDETPCVILVNPTAFKFGKAVNQDEYVTATKLVATPKRHRPELWDFLGSLCRVLYFLA